MVASKLKMTRRSFLKTAAVVGAAATLPVAASTTALAASDASPDAVDVKRVRTACRGCGKMECGVWVTVENGRAVKIEGDESSSHNMGNCCTKSQSSLQACYHPDRLRYPMKRTNPKGEDPGWVRISWDEAYDIIYEKMTEIYNKQGGSAFFQMSGTSRFWGLTGYNAPRVVGNVNAHVANQICKGPRRNVGNYTTENGHHFMATDDHPKVYLQWGSEQTQSNYDDSCRVVTDVVHDADCYISIDPRKHNLGKSADYHLALRPGSDSAMAMAWLYIVLDEGLYDELLCKRWTNAPMLVCEEKTPIAWEAGAPMSTLGTKSVYTHLLQEADLKEDGKLSRFMVWDAKHDRLTYFDADPEVAKWEGADHWNIPTTGWEHERGGWIPDPSDFEVDIDPALWGEYEVTLKDGRTVVCKTVFQYWWDNYVEECSPAAMAPVCDVDEQLIYDACRAWATRIDPRIGNGGVGYQLAPEQGGNCMHTLRALCLLSVITGNTDSPGGNRGVTRGLVDGCSSTGVPYQDDLKAKVPATKELNVNKALGKFWLWESGSDAATVIDAVLTGEPYPLRAAWVWSGDFMNQANSLKSFEALKGLEFQLETNLWHHPSTDLADVLLPVQHWLEVPGWARVSQGAGGHYGANCNCVDPIGDVKFDCDIMIELFKRWDIAFFDPAQGDPWASSEKYLDYQVRRTGMTWKEYEAAFQEHGWWDCKEMLPDQWGTYHRWETGAFRIKCASEYVGPGDGIPGTVQPDMKIDIYSSIIESIQTAAGLADDCPVLPMWQEPPLSIYSTPEKFEGVGEVRAGENSDKTMLVTSTTGRRIPVYFHSEHRQLPWCRELWPAPRVEINPEDAAKLDIKQGDWVWIENENGKIRQTADLYYGIKPGVINMEHQWWFPEMNKVGKGFELCGCNCLVTPEAQDPYFGASQLRGYPVTIYKATPENSPFNNPCPCDDEGVEIIHSASDPRLKQWAAGINAIASDPTCWEEYAK